IRNEATSRQAAARLRDLLQYGVAPPIWYQELNQLALAAESAENAFCIANGEVSDSAVDEIRRRRRDRARRRRSHAQKEVSKLFKILSKPAVKHLRIWARDAGVSVPSVGEFRSSRAAIRDILKIF